MKQNVWWSPNGSDGTLLSHRWVQAFVFELPPLKHAELQKTLRYKVQAMLPVNTEGLAFHTQLFRQGKKTFGAAFLASEVAKDVLPVPAKTLRVGVPLFLPKALATKALVFISTPEGLASYYYEERILRASFPPFDPDDKELRRRIIEKCPDAEIVGLQPDSRFPLPSDLQEKEPNETLRAKLWVALPLWEPAPPRRSPQVAAALLFAAGLTLCTLTLWRAWSARSERNQIWKAWLKRTESMMTAPSYQDQTAQLLKAQGAPVPGLFSHLAKAWGNDTRIVNLEWVQGKLTLSAVSASALTSLQKLTSDPWFRSIRIGDIRTQKDGSEIFVVEGSLSIDY